jgi:phospholipase/carboxylesterase
MERDLIEQIRLYYDLHVPEEYNKRRRYPLLIALHGYGGNKESMMKLARHINDRDWLIASLQGPYQFIIPPGHYSKAAKTGFGWAARYRHEDSVALHHETLLDLIEHVAADFSIDTERLFLLGFSQSVALNYRFAFSYPNVIRGVIGVCGGIPGDHRQKEYERSDTDVLHIAATKDEYYDLERVKTFVPWLEQHARSVGLRFYKSDHVFPRRSLSSINRWISERLTS